MKVKKFILILILTIFLNDLIFAQTQSFRIFPSTVTQSEPVITVSPLNRLVLFASAVTLNTSNGFKSEGVYVSTNGGLNWTGSDVNNGPNVNNHGGDPGVAIDKYGIFILNHIGSFAAGLYSHYSTNNGLNWSPAVTITTVQPEDKGTTTIDNFSSSPYYGRIYAVWVNYISPFPVVFSYSDSSGKYWSSPQQINNPPARCSGGFVEVFKNGTVYVCWARVINTSPFTEDYVGFAFSTNGGNNWTVNENIYDMNGINGTLPEKSNIRVNGLPQLAIDNSNGPRSGWLYIVTTEKNLPPAGTDPDIIIHRSTNGGINWSQGIRVNQDPLNDGKIQYFPYLAIDSSGFLYVLYYDDRRTTSDSAEVFLAKSTDGGDTWNEFIVSDQRFKPKPIIGFASNYQGDHIALLPVGKYLYALWMADYSGLYQIWCKILDITTISVRNISQMLPDNFKLYQNYPNPFNYSTNIRFDLKSNSNVYIEVYDLKGSRIFVSEVMHLNAGEYDYSLKLKDLASGVYFYRLIAFDNNSDLFVSPVLKLILLK
jgi:hypothetical protein